MKSEIQGLLAGKYCSPDGSAFLRVRKTDKGVIVEVVDEDADIFYAFTVDEKKKTEFEFGQASTSK